MRVTYRKTAAGVENCTKSRSSRSGRGRGRGGGKGGVAGVGLVAEV